ncbi:MAG: type II secretion system F family protein [Acidimicrobiales bacterium]
MSRNLRLLAVVLALFAFVVSAAPARAQIDSGEIQIVELDNSNYPEVELIVDVPQSFSDTVLTSRQFALQEGGVRRDIRVAKLEESTAIVLAIDTSGSMSGDPIFVAKQSAITFLDGLPPQHPVAVIGFGEQVTVASPLGTDREQTRAAINSLFSGGETTLYDALVSSAEIVGASSADRHAVVLLSDGADTQSVATEDQAVAALVGTDTTLYSVGLETGDSRLTDLRALTRAADGRYLPADDLAQLGAVYDDLAARLANQYRITFDATSTGSVELLLSVTSDGNLAVATSTTELAPAPVVAATAVPTAVAEAAPTPSTTIAKIGEAIAPGRLQAGWVFWAGAAALFFTFSVIAYSVMGMVRGQPTRRGLEPRQRQGERKLSGLADWASSIVDRVFLDGRRRGAMNSALDRAGLNVRPGEFIVLTACVAIAGFVLGWFVHPLVGLGVAIAIGVSARFFVGYLGRRRRNQFASQLDNTLLVLASSLRAGHGVQRALSAVAEESDAPTGEEFTRVVAETRIGRDLIEALQGVADRLGNEDFDWVVRAIAINRELGGNLSEVLDNVANTIRERNQLRRQVKALSAEGRLSAMVLYILPFGVAGFVRITNPGYLAELTESTVGMVFIVMAIIAMIGGGAWIKKIVNVRF